MHCERFVKHFDTERYATMAINHLFVRRALRSDAAVIFELGAPTFHEVFGAEHRPQDMPDATDADVNPGQVAAELDDPAAAFFLGYAGGKPAGYANLRIGPVPACVTGDRPIQLQRLYAVPGGNGKDYGTALMKACIDEARWSGRDTLWLGVWEGNERAVGFYRNWDFTAVGSRDVVVGGGVRTDIIMVRSLQAPTERQKLRR